jgi:hypothetical protein
MGCNRNENEYNGYNDVGYVGLKQVVTVKQLHENDATTPAMPATSEL